MSNFAIRAQQLSKHYRITAYRRRREMLSDVVIKRAISNIKHTLKSRKKVEEKEGKTSIWALKDINFEIEHGQSIGIIGANGAGKTTLLKVLAQITAPTEGRVRMRGRVGALLEVGTGFHSELTGRENIYLNGAVLGMKKKEIENRFDEIVDFSGVEDFIDTPIKFFSTGMRMRLAFAIAAHIQPEILLVDEVLAVGDVSFQEKSLGKMEEVTREGRTVLFVSHNLGAVKALCPNSIYLEVGKLKHIGDTETAIKLYLQEKESFKKQLKTGTIPIDTRKRVQILGTAPCSDSGISQQSFSHDEPIYIRIKVSLNSIMYKMSLNLKIYNTDMKLILSSSDFEPGGRSLLPTTPGILELQAKVPGGILVPGKYYLGAAISAQVSQSRVREVEKLEHTATFEIFDNGSIFSRMNRPWQGIVHPDVIWERIM